MPPPARNGCSAIGRGNYRGHRERYHFQTGAELGEVPIDVDQASPDVSGASAAAEPACLHRHVKNTDQVREVPA
jgi:hypothetical protein